MLFRSRKGLDLAVRALRGQQNAILAVVGRPPGITAPHLRYLGYRADMESVYPAVDCTLITSRYEPFGLVGVESVLCGTPVIAARNVGCAEVLSERAATRFDIDNTHSLTTAIDSALARWRDSSLRLSEPHAELGYAPSVQSHLDILLRWVDRLRNPQANAVQTA